VSWLLDVFSVAVYFSCFFITFDEFKSWNLSWLLINLLAQLNVLYSSLCSSSWEVVSLRFWKLHLSTWCFSFFLLLGQFCTLLDLSWKPPWRNFCAFKFSRAKGVSRCKTSRYLNVCYPWCPIFFHIIGFSICMQLSEVSDRCYGLTLAPGEQMIAVVCLRLLYPTSFCSTELLLSVKRYA